MLSRSWAGTSGNTLTPLTLSFPFSPRTVSLPLGLPHTTTHPALLTQPPPLRPSGAVSRHRRKGKENLVADAAARGSRKVSGLPSRAPGSQPSESSTGASGSSTSACSAKQMALSSRRRSVPRPRTVPLGGCLRIHAGKRYAPLRSIYRYTTYTSSTDQRAEISRLCSRFPALIMPR